MSGLLPLLVVGAVAGYFLGKKHLDSILLKCPECNGRFSIG